MAIEVWARLGRAANGAARIIETLLKHPIFAIALSLLVSVAAAGFNTLTLAHWLLIAFFATASFGVFATKAAARIPVTIKIIAVITCALICVSLNQALRSHAVKFEHSTIRKFPMPPLLLLFRPKELFAREKFISLAEQKLEVGYVSFPEGGYPSFTNDNESDDAMLGIQYFTLRNVSQNLKNLKFSLHVVGEGQDFTLQNDGHGRWQRQLNKNDFFAKQDSESAGILRWVLSPIKLPPNVAVSGSLGFVDAKGDNQLRKIIVDGEIDQRYKVELIVDELSSGQRFTLNLPFGTKPVVDQALKQRFEGIAKRQVPARP